MKNLAKIMLAAGFVSVGAIAFNGCCTTCEPDCGKKCEKKCEKKADAKKDCGCKTRNTVCTDCGCKGPVGRWMVRKDGAYWLGVKKVAANKYEASLLWGGGSPNPFGEVKVEGKTATMRRMAWGHKEKDPAKQGFQVVTLTANGDEGAFELKTLDGNGKEKGVQKYTAKRIPKLPAAPDLSKIVYGEPVDLFKDGMNGWESLNPNNYFGWSMKDGVLSNRIKRKADGKADGCSANIVTKRRDFYDFKIKYEVRVLPGCNSGVYLRGNYELQVLDSYGRKPDCHHMAAFYGRITPSEAAEKPANEWQTVEAILYNRHITVVLNGKKIIDNQPVEGCTGGALTSDDFAKGPIYLQGDHSDADFRNMVLTPIVK